MTVTKLAADADGATARASTTPTHRRRSVRPDRHDVVAHRPRRPRDARRHRRRARRSGDEARSRPTTSPSRRHAVRRRRRRLRRGPAAARRGARSRRSRPTSELALPVSYVEPLGFEDADAAIGETVTIAVTDAERTQHLVEATIVGVAEELGRERRGAERRPDRTLRRAVRPDRRPEVSRSATRQASVWFDPARRPPRRSTLCRIASATPGTTRRRRRPARRVQERHRRHRARAQRASR